MKIIRYAKKATILAISLLYKCFYRFIPLDDKTVLFISFHGKGYSDNPKAIYEEMLKDDKFKDYKFVWAIKNHKKKAIKIDDAKIVEYLSIPYFYYLSKAKYWIFNCKMPSYICKKKDQIYLQTWHGTPLKRLGHDIHVDENTTFYRSQIKAKDMYRSYDIDSARYNYMISPNAFCTKIFPAAFNINKERLIETGYPRNDVMSNVTDDEKLKIKKELNIPLHKKVILYAPTWRDNQYVAKGYTFKLEVDFHKWHQYLKDDYIVLFKPHYLIINDYKSTNDLQGFLYNIDADQDISPLYLITDILITDYSSVFYDFAVMNKPMYFYMYDLKDYQEELRGFYIDIYKDLPGQIYENEDDLLKDVIENKYDYAKLKVFKERFNNHDDGMASKRVVDIVFGDKK